MGLRRRWYVVSAALILASVLLLAFRGLNFGIDFTGGVVLELSMPHAADLEKVRGALDEAGFGDAVVQSFGTSRDVLVRVMPEEGMDVNAVSAKVLTALQTYEPASELRRTEVVGAQVGKELAEKGALAALFAFLLIMAYVALRFQWKLAVGSIVAALHDPIIILGIFSATQMTFDLPALAAVLAVVGYSLNDTVVVFDRIRERFIDRGSACRDHRPRHQRDPVANVDDQRHDADRSAVAAALRRRCPEVVFGRAGHRRAGRYLLVHFRREFHRTRPQADGTRPDAGAEGEGRSGRNALSAWPAPYRPR
jgi:preprotein translocase SecF subunit